MFFDELDQQVEVWVVDTVLYDLKYQIEAEKSFSRPGQFQGQILPECLNHPVELYKLHVNICTTLDYLKTWTIRWRSRHWMWRLGERPDIVYFDLDLERQEDIVHVPLGVGLLYLKTWTTRWRSKHWSYPPRSRNTACQKHITEFFKDRFLCISQKYWKIFLFFKGTRSRDI
jgi:hypothetical protein